jgi:hypothetical protein
MTLYLRVDILYTPQNRDYDDEDYVQGGGGVTIKTNRMGDKRLGGMPGAGGGMPRSSSDMSLAATHAGLVNKRLKNQMAPKPGEPGQPRCVIVTEVLLFLYDMGCTEQLP